MQSLDLYGWLVATAHPDDSTAALSMTSQTLWLCQCFILKTVTITTLSSYVGTAGATPTAGYNGYGIWAGNNSLTLLGSTADDTTLWTTAGWRPKALQAAVTLTAGTSVWLGAIARCGTAPQIRQTVAGIAGMLNGAPAGKTTGSLPTLSAAPASITKSGLTDQAFRPFIVGY